MTKYKCDYCDVILDEEDIEYKEESYESYYGVTDLPGRHYFELLICPVCGQADELYEYVEEDDEEDGEEDFEPLICPVCGQVDELYEYGEYDEEDDGEEEDEEEDERR